MAADIAPELYEKIKEAFESKYEQAKLFGNPISDTLKALEEGTATFRDADLYAGEVGSLLSEALKECISLDDMPGGKFYYNIATRTVGQALQDEYRLASNVAGLVQEAMNEAQGIGLKVVRPEPDQHRVRNVVDRAARAETQEQLESALTEPVKTEVRRASDDTQKANARLHNSAGLEVKVEREYDGVGLSGGRECSWCQDRAGTFTYSEAMANGVFERHEGCGCTITYTSKKGERTRSSSKYSGWETINQRSSLINKEQELLEIAKIRKENVLERQISNDIMQVATKTRNDIPLTKKQIDMCYEYAVSLGMPRELIFYSDTVNTGYFDLSGKLYIGTDVLPREESTNVNGRLSYRSAIAHELVGHRETCLKGTNFPAGTPEDEAQASIRAARFAEGLTQKDRYMLIKDGISRLKNSGIRINDIKQSLDIWER